MYSGDYLEGGLPPDTWGLSECSNYQFLSYSTVFGCSGTKYQFPHPAEDNMGAPIIEGQKIYFNGTSYGVPHMARDSYTYYKIINSGYMVPPSVVEMVKSTNTTDDVKVFEDYANITIPRTIDYATGLLNYFFRGRLEVYSECSGTTTELTIKNISENSGVPQSLKGGTLELYWDDADGNRAEVSSFSIDGGWNSESVLSYGDEITATLTSEPDANQYILVYKGNICENPADPDPDDQDTIAVVEFASCAPCYYCQDTPNLLLVELSTTPCSWEFNIGGWWIHRDETIGDLSGTYTLVQNPDYPCVWETTSVGNTSWYVYEWLEGQPADEMTIEYSSGNMELECDAYSWDLHVWYDNPERESVLYLSGDIEDQNCYQGTLIDTDCNCDEECYFPLYTGSGTVSVPDY
jgi:hypothetical protein